MAEFRNGSIRDDVEAGIRYKREVAENPKPKKDFLSQEQMKDLSRMMEDEGIPFSVKTLKLENPNFTGRRTLLEVFMGKPKIPRLLKIPAIGYAFGQHGMFLSHDGTVYEVTTYFPTHYEVSGVEHWFTTVVADRVYAARAVRKVQKKVEDYGD